MKQKITQGQADQIICRMYNSGKYQYTEDIIKSFKKKYEVVK